VCPQAEMILIVRGYLSIHIYAVKMKVKNQNLVQIGLQIRQLRESKAVSQEGFAGEVGLDRTYMGGVERGESIGVKSRQRTSAKKTKTRYRYIDICCLK